ncbi:FIG143263: Glycosyl transferase [hydrothermal vent metagenome]|uniref:FIG143263: Glycosyl transferase n=1 Tax=hydrothermal vent metagenome TaxID=652676 RepID=A0A3B1CYQ7_9ZZZZ
MTDTVIYILIPFYNNAKTIHDVVRESAKYLPVIAVDDGSTDNPPQMSEAILIRHGKNRGKGAALLTGMKKAAELGGTHVITLDGDGQHLPKDIPRFIEAVKKKPEAIWLGDRDMSGPNVPKAAIFGRRWSNFWIWFHTRAPVPDSLSGFRLYPVNNVLKFNYVNSDYVFEAEVLIRWGWAGLPIRWLGISVLYQPPGIRVSHFRMVIDNLRHIAYHTMCVPKSAWYRLTGRLFGAWHEEKPKGYYFWFSFFQMLILSIGRDIAYKLANFVTIYYFLLVGSARKDIKNFLRRIDPRKEPRLKDVWRSEKAFGEALVDRISRLSGQENTFHYKAINENNFMDICDSKRGIILLSAHVGPWDIGARLAKDHGIKMCMLMNRSEADYAQAFFENIESDTMKVITVDGGSGIIDIVHSLKNGWNVAMHGDRIMEGQRPVKVNFLGTETNFPSGPYQVAYVTGSPIVPSFSLKTGARDIEVHVFKPILPRKVNRKDRDSEIVRMAGEYVACLEQIVKMRPEQWFNFYDFFGERS